MWHCQLSRRPSVLAARSQPERVIRRRDKLTGAVQCGVAQKPFLVVSAVDTAIALPADICRRKKRTKVIQKPVRWRGPVEVEAKRNDVVAARRERGPVIEAQRSTGFWIMGAWERNMGAHFFYVGTGKRATGVRGAKAMANTSTHRALFPSTLPAMCFKSKRARGGGREW